MTRLSRPAAVGESGERVLTGRRGRLGRWWSRRTLRVKMALVVGVAAAVVLLVLARLGVGLLA
jgi:hypothetical protein